MSAPAAPYTEVVVQANQGSWGNNLADLNGDGYVDIIEGGGDLGGNVYWYQYPSWTRYQIGSDGGGDDLQVADINRDGAPDVVVNGTGKIVWYQNPRGTGGNVQGLWTKHVVDSTTQSHDIVLADLNRDGKIDIVIRVEEGPTFYYLQGATVDTWQKVSVPQAPDGHGGLEVADINRDGRPDIIENGFWLQGPANPATDAWIKRDIVSWTPGSSAAVYDINHDGRLDIFIAVSESGAGSLAWFEAPVDPINGVWIRHNIDTVEDVHRFFLVDVNKDGTEDLVFAEMHQSATRRVGVYYNNGLGASWTLQVMSTQGSHNIAVGDIGSDGDIDIVGANWNLSAPDGGAMKIWRNDLDNSIPVNQWTYIEGDSTRAENNTFGLTAGDINQDGWPDILSGRYWYRNPQGNLTGPWTRTGIGPYDGLFLMDVDDDGNLDVLAQAMIDTATVGFYRLTPSASYTTWTPLLLGTTPPTHPVNADHFSSHGFRLADIVPGGKPEIVLTSEKSIYYFQVPANPGAGNWPRVEITNTLWGQSDVEMSDVDGDGDPDAIGFYAEQNLAWWENPGNGGSSWTRRDIGTTANQMGGRVSVGDFNGDGRKDVVVSEANFDTSGNSLYWFECPATPQSITSWTRRTIISNLGSVHSVEVGDYDQNGIPDILTGTHRGTLQALILRSNDRGVTWTSTIVNTGFEAHIGLRTFDLDRDGDPDIISDAWDHYQFLYIWRNNALGGSTADTTPPQITGVGSSNVSAMSAQVNWTTNEPSDSKVDYGLTSSYGMTTTLLPLVGTHAVQLAGLTPDTQYHYRVTSKDASGNSAGSGDFVFTTSTPDSTPPQIQNVTVNPLLPAIATINWTTDEPADGRIDYGLDSTYGSMTALQSAFVTGHSIAVTGLTAGTTYHFRINTKDSSGNLAQSGDGMFTTPTPDTTLPSVSITAPTGGSVVGTIGVAATANDNVGVVGVQFYLDGSPLGSETTGPYTTSWNTTLVPNGQHTLTAVARDAAGNTKTSDAVVVTVANVILVAHRQGAGSTNDAGSNTIALAFPQPALAGDLIVASVSMGNNVSVTCTDSQGNSYTVLPVQFDSNNNQGLAVCYAPNVKAGATTVTVTFGSSVSYRRLLIHEYTGIAQTNPVDVTVAQIANATTAANSVTTTAGVTTTSNALIFATVMDDTGTTSIQAGTNFSLRGTVGGADLATEDRLLAAPGSVAGTFSFGNAHRYLARMVAFKTAAPSDTIQPDVAVTAPTAGDTVSGDVQFTATASDNVGVVGLQFKVGGQNIGNEITNGNYMLTWDSTSVSNGQAIITAVARDAAGNTRTSADVTVNVNNVDSTPPGFQNVTATSITLTGATITWTTTEPGTSQVQYGTDSTFGSSAFTALDTSLTTSHSQLLAGLTPGTTYFYRVLSTDAANNAGTSASSMFATLTPDTTPPSISNLNAGGIGLTGATITWTTNEPASTQVEYGLDTNYGSSTTLISALTSAHSVPLGGLTAATTYFYRVLSTDGAGNTGSATSFFTTATPDTTPPALSVVSVTNVTSSSATISWTTNEAGTSQVRYGTSTDYGQQTALDSTFVLSHAQTLTNLQAGTLYHLQAVSSDASANTGTSADTMFTTLSGEPDVPTPGLVSRWKLNETSGTTAADSQGTNTGTLGNFACTTLNCSATSGWTAPGQFAGALNFDGANDVMTVPANATLNNLGSFTYAAWIFPRSLGEGNVGRIIDKSGTGYKRFRLNNSTTRSFFGQVRLSTTNAVATSPSNSVSLNEWQHVVMTFDGATRVLRIYKNGVQIASATGAGTPQSDATGNFLVGNNAAGSATFNGLIDDVMVYSRALTPQEVQALAGGAPDLTPPQISGQGATGLTTSSATIVWNTDELADSSVEYGLDTNYGTTTTVNPALVTAHSVPLSGLTPGTTYQARVLSRDSSGNLARSANFSFSTVAPDTTLPTVSLVTPAAGNVSGAVDITASADDNVGVASVQYFIDGTTALSGLLTTSPYTFSWNTAAVTNGNHTLTAVAKDAAGNAATSPGVVVNVSNVGPPPVNFVQAASSSNNAASTTIAQPFSSPITLGNLIVVSTSWGNNSAFTCSDSQGNVYAMLPATYDSANHQSLGVCYAANAKAGATTVTVTFGSSAEYRRVLVHEYSGIAKTNPLDVSVARTANGTTAANNISSGSVTTTTPGDLVFVTVMDDAGTTNITAGTGFTLRAVTSSDLASEDRVQPAAGAITGTFTFSNGHRYIIRIVTFKAG